MAALQELVARLTFESVASPVVYSATIGRVEITVSVRPVETGETECERAVVAVLADQTGPRTVPWIEKNLAARGQIYGERTIRRAIANLRDRGAIVGSQKSPRGYSLVA
jgi:predicted HTH transcriptional regulator